jgi:hypothetical protein
LHIEMLELAISTHAVLASHAMSIEPQGCRVHIDVGDAALFDRFTARSGDEIHIIGLDMATELEPATNERMQGEQYATSGGVDDEGAAGEVADAVAT